MYMFKLPIGDWSNDGHGECEDFIVKSNKDISDVREAHYRILEATGVDILAIANDYQDSRIDGVDLFTLVLLGLNKDEISVEYNGEHYVAGARAMALIWTTLLMEADNELKLDIVDDEIPSIVFYGFDEKKRHIHCVGYGLFE